MRRLNVLAASFTGLVLLSGLGGCAAQQRQEVIPATAHLQMSSNGHKVYTTPSEGTVYVYDKPGDRLIWSGQVHGGQVVSVVPEQSQVTLNGSPVSNRMQVGNGQIDLYFEPAPTPAQPAGVTLERTRSTTSTPSDGSTTVTAPGSFTVQPPPVTVTPSVRVEQQPVPANSVATPTPTDPGK